MRKLLLYLFLTTYPLLLIAQQDTLIKRFPNGKVQEMRIMINGEVVKATEYHYVTVKSTDTIGTREYWIRYSWDKQKKLIESYWSVLDSDTDKLLSLFFKLCPDYTIKQHYGNGPLDYIENYKNGVRDGDYEKYDEEGKLVEKGQFSNWEKVGIWKYYDKNGNVERTIITSGDYNEHGLSINYTIVPVIVTILITLLLGIFISKKFGYRTFYIYYCIGVIIYSITFPLTIRLIGQMAKYPLVLWLSLMFVLSVINLFIAKKVKVRIRKSIIYAVLALILGVFYFILYIQAMLANAINSAVLF